MFICLLAIPTTFENACTCMWTRRNRCTCILATCTDRYDNNTLEFHSIMMFQDVLCHNFLHVFILCSSCTQNSPDGTILKSRVSKTTVQAQKSPSTTSPTVTPSTNIVQNVMMFKQEPNVWSEINKVLKSLFYQSGIMRNDVCGSTVRFGVGWKITSAQNNKSQRQTDKLDNVFVAYREERTDSIVYCVSRIRKVFFSEILEKKERKVWTVLICPPWRRD